MNVLLSIDLSLFDFISTTLKNGFFDLLMPLLSDAKFWRIPLAVLWLGFIIFGKRKGLRTALLCLLAVGITDLVCGGVLQPLVQRPRPLGGVTHSFPSCHAANTFAAAFVIAYFWRQRWVKAVAFGLALAVCYSRVYTTSHYPSDVVAGALIGSVLAYGVIALSTGVEKRVAQREPKTPPASS